MRLETPDLGHLTYCTNIHPGETWPEVMASLESHLLAVRRSIAPDRRFGVGLRLSARAAEALDDPDALGRFEAFLREHDLYVFTLNGFPYGPFHGTRVKEDVYQPDWRRDERVAYTDRLADLLGRLLPDDEPGLDGSISTVPGTFRPLAQSEVAIDAMADNLIRHVAHLIGVRERTGKTVALAIEPEPMCFLETIDETATFFERHLFSDAAARRLAELSGRDRPSAEMALRRHLGVCYDICHAAVEFEDPKASLERLRAAGIQVAKLQISAALRVPDVRPDVAERLRPFDDGVYLHQVVERRGDGLVRHLDLPQAFAALEKGEGVGSEWRVHFHVPVFMAELEHFATTQDFIRDLLAIHRYDPISRHLEVETYTFGVLPETYRQDDVATAVSRELAWTRDQLAG